ncbi:MAG: TonB-dependent receptor plug domain-containing protein, partial [Alphaproteobacteria bacterium]|nr:TonB-dependent receptor plug domain-containing protein [Alphaproteobacteria bacterium]
MRNSRTRVLRSRVPSIGSSGRFGRAALSAGCSVVALGAFAPVAWAQDSAPGTVDTENVIVVTGVRASLERAMDIKREAYGVVDAISAEDIGKFPDTNLAESLQRIPGVSISRVNGEGSQVTVRGFGPQFNLVTVNGRQIATTFVNAVGGDQDVDFSRATGRSFDKDVTEPADALDEATLDTLPESMQDSMKRVG